MGLLRQVKALFALQKAQEEDKIAIQVGPPHPTLEAQLISEELSKQSSRQRVIISPNKPENDQKKYRQRPNQRQVSDGNLDYESSNNSDNNKSNRYHVGTYEKESQRLQAVQDTLKDSIDTLL